MAHTNSDNNGDDSGGSPALRRALPYFSFSKQQQSVIERVKVEVCAGAKFVEKLFAKQQKQGQAQGQHGSDEKLDVSEILNPRKKQRKNSAGPKNKAQAKAKAKARASGDAADEEDADALASAVSLGDFGSERARWWIDDMLCSIVHAAGGDGCNYHSLPRLQLCNARAICQRLVCLTSTPGL